MATGGTKEHSVSELRASLGRVRATIAASCAKVRRDPAGVQLVAVTKYVEPAVIQALLEAGATDLGESRVQQLIERARFIGAAPAWHMIGHLQRNKIRMLLPYCRIVHSLDSLRLAEELESHAAKVDATIDVYLEVNVAGEESKGGISMDEAGPLAERVRRMPHIRMRGLMTMAPLSENAEDSRPHFARLRETLGLLRDRGVVDKACDGLSMGMSQDYAVAVEEGATVVRVGSALFPG